jgi:DNA-binding NarL/FixJ family response regulator
MRGRFLVEFPGGDAVLTGAEWRVFRCLGMGMTNQEIGKALFRSINTVKLHLRNIREKIGIDDRTKLALLANRECRGGDS